VKKKTGTEGGGNRKKGKHAEQKARDGSSRHRGGIAAPTAEKQGTIWGPAPYADQAKKTKKRERKKCSAKKGKKVPTSLCLQKRGKGERKRQQTG